MDKRSLLFIACISGAYFALQALFGTWNAPGHPTHEARALLERTEKANAADRERFARTADLSALPITALFKDPLGREHAAWTLKMGGCYLAIAWQKELPETLYLPTENSFEALVLAKPPARPNDPVLYQKAGANQIVQLPPVPSFADLQLLTLGESMQVVLGEQRNAEIVFPYAYLDQPAIALLKQGRDYVPIGIYEPSAHKVKPLADFAQISSFVAQTVVPLSPSADRQETFYALETPYQQLIFSTRGGSLAEINLPFSSANHPASIVKEIHIDRQILADSPQNARFPLHPFFSASGESSPTLQESGSLGGYYPLLRRGILGTDGAEKHTPSPNYYALQIIGATGEVEPLDFRVTDFNANRIRFEASDGMRRVVKTYTIPLERNGPYCFELEIQIEGDANSLWLSSGVPDVELVGGSYAPQLKYQVQTDRGTDVEELPLPKDAPQINSSVAPYWISNCNGFLGLIVDPLSPSTASGYKVQKVDGSALPTRLSLIDAAYNLYPASKYPGYTTSLPIKNGTSTFRIFAGPYDEALLRDLDELYSNPAKNYHPEYTLAISIQGWFSFISQPFSKFLFLLMQLFYAVSRSWAVSIILLTIALRAMMYPLNNWSLRSTMKMQELAPRIKAVQEKYKKDPNRAKTEMMNLYKTAGVSPFGGCLPMLLQMPFLFGMFYMLKSSFPLRGASFIPGWIDDLAAPDILFSWGEPFWLIGNEFHLLPVLTGLVMFAQGKMSQKPPQDPNKLTDSERQQKMMTVAMAGVFTIVFYSFPSGLNIYFMFSTLFGILQQRYLKRPAKQLKVVK